jgi:putative Mg2+ transporter-C (MgtC) family protein
VVLTLGVLSVFRWIETRMPAESYFHFDVRFARSSEMTEAAVRALVERHGFRSRT